MAILRRNAALMLMLVLVSGLGARYQEKGESDGDDHGGEPGGKLELHLNPGGHTGSIRSMVFSPDGKKLYTAGPPGDVEEWDVDTGDQLRVWRFPDRASRLTLSPDGSTLVFGGYSRLNARGKPELPVWLIPLGKGVARVHTIDTEHEFTARIAMAPDGKSITVAAGPKLHLLRPGSGKTYKEFDDTSFSRSLEYDRSSKRLLITRLHGLKPRDRDPLRIMDVSPKGGNKQTGVWAAGRISPMAAWSPDGGSIACVSGGDRPYIQMFAASDPTKAAWGLPLEAMGAMVKNKVGEGGEWTPIGLAFRPKPYNDLITCWHQGRGLKILRVDLDKKIARAMFNHTILVQHARNASVAVSRDGSYLAVSTNPAYRVAMYDLKRGMQVVWTTGGARTLGHFGPSIRKPTSVRWTADGEGVIWGYAASQPKVGLSVAKLELDDDVNPGSSFTGAAPNDWKLEMVAARQSVLKRPGRKDVTLRLRDIDPGMLRVFKDGDKERLLVRYRSKEKIGVMDGNTGEHIDDVGRVFYPVHDMSVSPNGKYLAVAGGGQFVHVYSLDRRRKSLLNVVYDKGDWVAWTPEGYYAGTPGGERLIGWKVSPDPNRPSEFYPANRFRKAFFKPDLIKNLLAAGSLKAALKGAAEAKVDDLLPPEVKIIEAKPIDAANPRKYLIKAEATPGSAKQPIEGMRLWLDGKLLPDKPKTLARSASGKASVAEWVVEEMPEGEVELKVIARCAEVNGISPLQPVKVVGKPKAQPKLHVVSIGLNYAHDKDLKLNCAVNDATAVAEAFPKACVGANHFFKEKAASIVLLDDKATAKAITDVLAKLKKDVKRHDLVVFFYAGHGEREKDEFYLLTAGAKTGDLKGTALSGTTLREALKEVQGQVLLVLDACHSGHAGKALRGASPVADEASRSLADEECAVTLLAAAMSHERALEEKGGKHGFFTEALLTTLKASASVAHNKFDGQQYVTHLASDVLDEVQHRSKDRQHPFLSQPWTVEPFPIRRVKP